MWKFKRTKKSDVYIPTCFTPERMGSPPIFTMEEIKALKDIFQYFGSELEYGIINEDNHDAIFKKLKGKIENL